MRKLLLLAFLAIVLLAGCGGSSKSYDIAPIFPLSENKCAQYGGTQEGSGITESCMVTKEACEQASADWREAMQESGVTETIEFSCD